jgi:tRNA threonylcarbamoyladenosine biosynthesis protein TsaB
MSWTLGIDCSSVEMGLGLADGQSAVASVSRYLPNAHAEHLDRTVGFLLDANGVKPADVTSVGVAVGPGSFTGLRIALAFVKGFCFERPVRVLPLSSLESVALAWGPSASPLVVAFDARRDEVFWARFSWMSVALRRDTPDALASAAALAAVLSTDDAVVIDTLGFVRSTVFAPLAKRPAVYSLERYPRQRGLACAPAAANEPGDSPRWTTPLEVQPCYLRESYAEERRARGAV